MPAQGAHSVYQDEAFARALVEAAPTAIIILDPDGKVAEINDRALDLFGHDRPTLIGAHIETLIPRFHLAEPADGAAFATSPSASAEQPGEDLLARHADGNSVPVQIAQSRIGTGERQFTLVSVSDVSARRLVEAELERSNAELEKFTYIASHDLQEPLRMVANYVELLADRYRGKLDERADKYIHFASDGAHRMQQIVADLLAYSRVGTRGKPLAPVHMEEVIGQAQRALGGRIRASGAVIVAGPMPWVLGDDVQLGQLVQNLIGNAIKFRGEAPPHIRVEAKAHGGQWLFSVSDNGIGMEMRHADRIFEMFQRLEDRTTYEGSGIGLAIAKRIVERHGGLIWVDSERGKGATFRFTLNACPEGVPS